MMVNTSLRLLATYVSLIGLEKRCVGLSSEQLLDLVDLLVTLVWVQWEVRLVIAFCFYLDKPLACIMMRSTSTLITDVLGTELPVCKNTITM